MKSYYIKYRCPDCLSVYANPARCIYCGSTAKGWAVRVSIKKKRKKKVVPGDPQPQEEEVPSSRQKSLLARIQERDGVGCLLCGTEKNLTKHHIVHRSQRGTDKIENLQVLCRPCHSRVHNELDIPSGTPVQRPMSTPLRLEQLSTAIDAAWALSCTLRHARLRRDLADDEHMPPLPIYGARGLFRRPPFALRDTPADIIKQGFKRSDMRLRADFGLTFNPEDDAA